MIDYCIKSSQPIDLSSIQGKYIINWIDNQRVNIRMLDGDIPDVLKALQVFPVTPDNMWL